MPDDPRYYMDFTGTGNSLNPVHPSVLRLIMDSLRYFVTECHVDGFRFDLAVGARARVLRRRPAVGVLRRDPPGPGAVAGQADRRAVGRRARAATRSATSRCCGSEWNGIYRDTMRDFWRGQARRRRLRQPPHRLVRPLRVRRPPPVRVDQLHHRARRLHAARPRLLQREAQRGEPRGQPRRHRRQPLLELRRRGRRPTTPRSTSCARRQQRNFLTTLLLSQGVPMLLGGDERWPHARAATTTPGARTTRSRGSTGTRRRARGALLDVHAAADRAAPRAPRVPPQAATWRARRRRARACPTSGGSAPTGRRMTRARLAVGRAACVGMFLNGEEIVAPGPHGERDRGRLVPAAVQRATTRTATFTLPNRALRRRVGARAVDRRPGRGARAAPSTTARARDRA